MLAQSATKKRLRQNEKEKPRKYEQIEKMYEILHNTKKMRCTITHPKLRNKRSPHLKGSASTTRLMGRKSLFAKFIKKLLLALPSYKWWKYLNR